MDILGPNVIRPNVSSERFANSPSSTLKQFPTLLLKILIHNFHSRMFNIVEFLTRIGLNLFTCKSFNFTCMMGVW